MAEVIDAFQYNLSGIKGYINPYRSSPQPSTQVILVVPVWKSQNWYPFLLEMLSDLPMAYSSTRLLPTDGGTAEGSGNNSSISHLACLNEKCLSAKALENSCLPLGG